MAAVSTLGSVKEIDLHGAKVRYYERGDGPPVVFVHCLLVNAYLWRKVVPGIATAGYRCLAPDWPFGSHAVPVPEADLTPSGAADVIASFLEALTQVARIPGSVRLATEVLRIRALHRLPIGFGWLVKRPLPNEVMDVYLQPSRRDPAIRKDLRRFVAAVDKSYTLEAAKSFPDFEKPVLLAWASEDRFFPVHLAQRLVEDLPNATLKTIDDCYTFVPEEQPEQLVELVLAFMRAPASS